MATRQIRDAELGPLASLALHRTGHDAWPWLEISTIHASPRRSLIPIPSYVSGHFSPCDMCESTDYGYGDPVRVESWPPRGETGGTGLVPGGQATLRPRRESKLLGAGSMMCRIHESSECPSFPPTGGTGVTFFRLTLPCRLRRTTREARPSSSAVCSSRRRVRAISKAYEPF